MLYGACGLRPGLAQAATCISGRTDPSHFQADSQVSSPRARLSPISSANTKARKGASAIDAQLSPAVVVSARKVVPASIEALTFRAMVSFCDCSVPARRWSITR